MMFAFEEIDAQQDHEPEDEPTLQRALQTYGALSAHTQVQETQTQLREKQVALCEQHVREREVELSNLREKLCSLQERLRSKQDESKRAMQDISNGNHVHMCLETRSISMVDIRKEPFDLNYAQDAQVRGRKACSKIEQTLQVAKQIESQKEARLRLVVDELMSKDSGQFHQYCSFCDHLTHHLKLLRSNLHGLEDDAVNALLQVVGQSLSQYLPANGGGEEVDRTLAEQAFEELEQAWNKTAVRCTRATGTFADAPSDEESS